MDNINDKDFQVSVKGLFFDSEGRVMMLLQKDSNWEPSGGRMQKGEDLIETVKRETLEETGLECEVVDQRPLVVYSAIDQVGRARIMIYYKIRFESLDFKPSDECVDLNFFSKDDLRNLQMVPQIKPLADYL